MKESTKEDCEKIMQFIYNNVSEEMGKANRDAIIYGTGFMLYDGEGLKAVSRKEVIKILESEEGKTC